MWRIGDFHRWHCCQCGFDYSDRQQCDEHLKLAHADKLEVSCYDKRTDKVYTIMREYQWL